MSTKIQKAQQRINSKPKEGYADYAPKEGSSGISKVRELIFEVDMIKRAHQEKKRSQSRKSVQQKQAMDKQVLALLRKK